MTRIGRRAAVKGGVGLGFGISLAPILALAQNDPASIRPKEGDLLVIAVQSGWGIDSRAMQARLNTASPGNYPPVPEGGAIWVFAVK